jgi:hypothetical protein
MRLVLAITIALSLVFPATAQTRPELTPEQKVTVWWSAVNAITAFVVGAPVFLYVTAIGKQAELCVAMKGTYNPKSQDICEGGDWVRIVPYLRDVKE